MVQIILGRKEISCKIVYYGPGMSGKTTNLEVVHKKVPEQNRGELTSISTDGDRTLYFDYMPLDLGQIAGMNTKFQLYTVPGQVYYNSTRKLVLQGVDGIVFVADSNPAKMKENLESLHNLEENLREYGKSLKALPHVIQFNKRDLPDAMPVAEMGKQLNAHNVPIFEAVASTGQGVFPTLKALASLVLDSVNKSGARAPAAASVSASAPAAVSAGSSPKASSPFTGNAPPGQQENWQPPTAPGSGEEVASPQKGLPQLMSEASKQDVIHAHSQGPQNVATTPAQSPMGMQSKKPSLPGPVPTKSAAAKIARAPLPAAKVQHKPAAKLPAPQKAPTNKIWVYAVVFGVLVLGAAAGIVMVLLS